MAKKYRVLIVDNEAVIRQFLLRFLKLFDFEAEAHDDVYMAIGRAREEVYDLLFAEVKMPQMGGLALFRELKKSKPSLKCIMMAGSVRLNITDKERNEGIISCVGKPFDLNEVGLLLEKFQKECT